MEGDVMMHSLAQLLAIGMSVIGVVFALLKWFAGRLLADIEARLSRIDDLENRFERLMAELPLHYQRREDAIREYTTINAKLDRLWEAIIEVRNGR